MSRRKGSVAAVAVALLATGCSDDGPPEREASGLAPTFAPAEDAGESPAGDSGGSPTSVASAQGSTTITRPGEAPASEPPTMEASIADAAGDATASPIDPPPPWADLLGARLIRSQSGFELRIKLAGGDAPEESPDGDHTMNLASFYDVDGDGHIDYEIWANVASGGWGPAYFDNGPGSGGFGDDSGITVTIEADEVVLRFPLAHLANAQRFRWSIASEWGRYEAIGTPAMVRDEAPDDDQPASFPGT